jgi:phage-related protein (TIGR01555 family)
MSKRIVKTASAALARTNKPVTVGDGLINVVAGLGTSRDKMSYTEYDAVQAMTQFQLEQMYRSSWLAKRIVNAVADDMTRAWRTMTFDDKGGKALAAVQRTEKRFDVKGKFNAALRWSRLYGGSLIIIGTRDKDLSKPLDVTRIKKGDLQFLHVLDRWRAAPSGEITDDLNSPNFGLPSMYIIAESAVQIHWTRVLRFNGQKLPYFSWRANGMWDDSELQHVYDSIRRRDSSSAAVATMLFEANVDVVTTEDLNEILSRKDGEALLTKRFQTAAMLKSFNRMLLLGGTEKYEKKSNTFANLDKILREFAVDVCGAADIPMTRLFGQSAGGLNANGDNDVRNYYDRIVAEQESDLQTPLEYLDEIVIRSELGFMPENYSNSFNTLWQKDDKEESEIGLNDSQTDDVYLSAGLVSKRVIGRALKARGRYDLTDEEINQLPDKPEEAPEPPALPAAPPIATDPVSTKKPR